MKIEVGKNLNVLMAEKFKKISDIQKETGISRTTITNLIKNRANGINFETLETLCDYFNCGVSELLEKK